MDGETVMAKGNCERIGLEEGIFTHKTLDGRQKKANVKMQNHKEAFMQVRNALTDSEFGVIESFDEISAVGHRIVQGGALFSKSMLIDEKVKKGIEELIPLAPLHNKPHLEGICACEEVFKKETPQVAVFDTSFHMTMPPKAYMFAVPYKYYEDYNIRRYGAHGTSHRFVSNRCAELMGKDIKDNTKIVTCHIGNGSSITAIKNGDVQDTSMGLTPLDGIMMGTRSGRLDPSVVVSIAKIENNPAPNEISDILNKQSGLLGISGISSDDRDVSDAAAQGNERAILAHDMLRYQMLGFVGQYITILGGCDAIVFTAGLGENNPDHRRVVCEGLAYLGVKIDNKINDSLIRGKEGKISTPDSTIQVFVIPTNEELVIARDTKDIVESM
jgi:acetate kinase